MSSLTAYDLPIEGMTCASCAGRVERALERVPRRARPSIHLHRRPLGGQ
nr:heavy metal-associated domain-containing protein [Pseudomonas sp. 2FG]